MTYYYLDTSCLVKRYADEAGRDVVVRLVHPDANNVVYVCEAAGPELVAALVRRAKGNAMTRENLDRTLTAFLRHWHEEYRRLVITSSVVEQAMRLAQAHALRGYDAIHLAAAIELAEALRTHRLPDLVFVSADEEQLTAAATEKLAIMNPTSLGENSG